MQVVEVNVPVLLVVKVTVPVGTIAPVPDASATVAVQLVGLLVLTEAGVHATVVVVDLMVEASVNVPLLPVWTESPLYVPVIRA
jgi:hypothetical protein